MPPTPVETATAPPSATCRPTDQDQYVYHPARLAILQPCIRVVGTVTSIRREADGDLHIRLALDAPYASLLVEANRGALVVEPVCVGPVSQADAVAVCAADPDPLRGLPKIGDHVWMEGRYVADLAHGGWRALVPEAARWPFELLVAPEDHEPDLPSLDATGRDAMAVVLLDALGRLDRLFGAPMPYMLWVHQRPTDGGDWPTAHVHVEIAPFYRAPGTPRFIAAGELGSGVYFNPVEPADAARMLREVPG